MKTVNELLGINFSSLSTHGLNTNTLQYHFERQKKVLQKISAAIDDIDTEFSKTIDHGYLIDRFYSALAKKDYKGLNRKELRNLTYLVTTEHGSRKPIVSNEVAFQFFLELCKIHWSNIVLSSLVFLLFKLWEHPQQKQQVENLRKLILSKIKLYTGKRKHLVFLKENPRFINDKSGPIKVASFCSKYYDEIESLTSSMQLSPSWLALSYYESAIVMFVEHSIKLNKSGWELNLESILNLGISSDIKKRVLARFILAEKLMQSDRNRRLVRQWAVQYIGKPQNSAAWKLDNDVALPSEKEMIEKARRQVLAWIARGVIEFFFEKCINEPRRQKFWLQYASEISDVRVFGSYNTKRLLQKETRFNDLLVDYFTMVNSSSETAAIVMYVKDYALIEFSDTGNAFFAMKAKNYSIKKRLYNVEELKPQNVPTLLKRYRNSISHLQNEGRLSHHDGIMDWEEYFKKWITQKVGVYV